MYVLGTTFFFNFITSHAEYDKHYDNAPPTFISPPTRFRTRSEEPSISVADNESWVRKRRYGVYCENSKTKL